MGKGLAEGAIDRGKVMGLARWLGDDPESSQVKNRRTRIEGQRMHFSKVGAGPELILLHGLLGTAAAWEPAVPMLAAQSTVYAIDALGIGGSERVPGIDPGLRSQARRIDSFMQAEGIPSADFLATSHGGAVALMLAARYPERVRTLVLHAPANPFSNLGDPLVRFYKTWLGRWFAHRIPTLPESVQATALAHMYGDATQVREGSLERYVASLRVPGTVDYLLDLVGNWFKDMCELKEDLDRMRGAPALLIWGDRDRAVSLESAQRLRQILGQPELVVLPGVGHLAFEECPQIFADVVNSFLSRQRRVAEPGLREPGLREPGLREPGLHESGPRLVPRRAALA
jgi:pimeloyl-ACP methyl ester carboxylesterase